MIHILRVNENGIKKWWFFTEDYVMCGKSDWSLAKMGGLWRSKYGEIWRTKTYDGLFTIDQAIGAVRTINPNFTIGHQSAQAVDPKEAAA